MEPDSASKSELFTKPVYEPTVRLFANGHTRGIPCICSRPKLRSARFKCPKHNPIVVECVCATKGRHSCHSSIGATVDYWIAAFASKLKIHMDLADGKLRSDGGHKSELPDKYFVRSNGSVRDKLAAELNRSYLEVLTSNKRILHCNFGRVQLAKAKLLQVQKGELKLVV